MGFARRTPHPNVGIPVSCPVYVRYLSALKADKYRTYTGHMAGKILRKCEAGGSLLNYNLVSEEVRGLAGGRVPRGERTGIGNDNAEIARGIIR